MNFYQHINNILCGKPLRKLAEDTALAYFRNNSDKLMHTPGLLGPITQYDPISKRVESALSERSSIDKTLPRPLPKLPNKSLDMSSKLGFTTGSLLRGINPSLVRGAAAYGLMAGLGTAATTAGNNRRVKEYVTNLFKNRLSDKGYNNQATE